MNVSDTLNYSWQSYKEYKKYYNIEIKSSDLTEICKRVKETYFDPFFVPWTWSIWERHLEQYNIYVLVPKNMYPYDMSEIIKGLMVCNKNVLFALLIDPSLHNQGYGKMAMNILNQILLEQYQYDQKNNHDHNNNNNELPLFRLQVHVDNVKAQSLYEKYGHFIKKQKLIAYYQDKKDAYLYVWKKPTNN